MATIKVVASVAFLALIGHVAECRPPVQQYPEGRGVPLQKETNDTSDWNLGLEYNRYLQEVVQVLESDPEFRKKLETADVEKIRDGSIAHELEMVNHQVRSQLDVIKRKELERLRHLAMRQFELQNGIDKRGRVKMPQHIELQNPTFEIEDLKKLIKTTTKDLEEADRKRRDEFKRYEMEKKFEHNQRLQHIEDEDKRQEEEARMEEMEKRHRQHGKINHPMTKDQLEGVWEEQDHMRPQDWDPKTFFAMHDLNGDKFWDEDEVRVLFKKELDKVYDPNAPEDDMREREEEMERMREHVFGESDLNKDRLISFEEFLAETKRDEFEKDPGWDTLDQDKNSPFSDEEFKAYEMQRMREIQGMINRGIVPEGYPYYGAVPPGAPVHPQFGGPGQPYMPPVHPGQLQQGQGMNVQPLRGEANYRQPPPQFGAGQPQQQFGQPQQFAQQPVKYGQQQQFGQQVPQQQQFGQPQQQQQQFGQPQQQQQQFGQPQQQQQQFAPQQPQKGQQFAAQPSQQQGQAASPPSGVKVAQQQQQQPVEKSQENPPPQPRGQPVIRAQKLPDAAPAQQQQNP